MGSLTHFDTRINSKPGCLISRVTEGLHYLVRWLPGTRRETDSSLKGISISGYAFRGESNHANIQFRMTNEEKNKIRDVLLWSITPCLFHVNGRVTVMFRG